MKTFCVYLITYRGNKLPPFYIGSTSLAKINAGYMGSVSSKQYKEIWKKEIQQNPHLFNVHVLSTHPTRNEASMKEATLQKKMNARSNSLYVNMADWHRGHLNYTHERSAEHNENLAKANRLKAKERIGFNHTEHAKKLISDKNSTKTYIITDDNGSCEVIKNLGDWCKDRGLKKVNVYRMAWKYGKYRNFKISIT